MPLEVTGANAPKLNRVIRLDNLPLNQTFFTEEGYLRDRPIVTRTGIFEYSNSDGSVRRELRLPEDVFDPASLASYRGKPVVITHDAGLISKENVHEHQIGTILSEGYRSGENVRAEIVIHDTDAMKDCKMKELSLGYSLDLEEAPGEWNGQHYDAIQRNIRINHLALVSEARAGEKARLNIDGRDSKKTLEGGDDMKVTHKKARADSVLSAEELEQAIAEYKAKRNAPETAVQDGNEEIAPETVETSPVPEKAETDVEEQPVESTTEPTVEDTVEEIKNSDTDDASKIEKLYNIIDSLLAKLDFNKEDGESLCTQTDEETLCDGNDDTVPAAEENKDQGEAEEAVPATEQVEPKINADSVDEIVRARIQVGMMGKALNMDGLENMKLLDARKAVIKAVRPGIKLDGKSAAYVDAAYDMACDAIRERNTKDTSYQKRQMFNKENHADAAQMSGNGESAAERRQAMINRTNNKNKED